MSVTILLWYVPFWRLLEQNILQGSPKQSDHLLTLKLDVLCVLRCSCLTLWPHGLNSPPGSSVRGDSPGKNTGVGCHALLQEIFPTQQSNLGFPHCRRILYYLSHWRSPIFLIVMSHLWKVKSLLPFGICVILSFVFLFFFLEWWGYHKDWCLLKFTVQALLKCRLWFSRFGDVASNPRFLKGSQWFCHCW